MRTKKTPRFCMRAGVAAVALALSGMAAGQASAAGGHGTLAYTKGGKLWRSNPDGSGKRRITRKGGFEHPSQADNGMIVALRGNSLYRFSRRGRQLGKPRRVSVGLTNPGPLHELPQAPEVSPNGKRVAMFKTLLQGIYDPQTGVKGMNILAVTVQFRSTSSGRLQLEIHQPGDYYENPSWTDNNHILFFAPFNGFAPEVFTETVGQDAQGWFADEFNGEDTFQRQPLNDGELSPAHDKLALIKGTNIGNDWSGALVQLYSVSSLSQLPTPACSFHPPGHGPFSGPSWSPDGGSIAWSDRTGVWTSAVNLSAANCGVAPKLVARGGAEPDWGRR